MCKGPEAGWISGVCEELKEDGVAEGTWSGGVAEGTQSSEESPARRQERQTGLDHGLSEEHVLCEQ